MTFLKYPHLERFGNTEVADIEFGVTHIFPKLDGTNASIWVEGPQPPNDKVGSEWWLVRAGSRNLVLSPEKDNAGFLKWIDDDIQFKDTQPHRIYQLLKEYPQYRLYGEWLVPHTVKHYRDDMWRRFWVFDVWDNTQERMLTYDEYQPLMETYGIDYVPCIKIIKNGSYENFMHEARTCRFGLVEGNKPGEGVVIKNYHWTNKHGRQPWAKIVLNEFKDDFYAKMGANVVENKTGAQAVCEMACTPHLIDKEYAKIVTEENGWERKYIPRLLHTVFYSVVKEELWDSLKKINYGSVNFQELRKHCEMKVKEHRKDLF